MFVETWVIIAAVMYTIQAAVKNNTQKSQIIES